jgi:hypothetical protein
VVIRVIAQDVRHVHVFRSLAPNSTRAATIVTKNKKGTLSVLRALALA